jgi:hypothetical protein
MTTTRLHLQHMPEKTGALFTRLAQDALLEDAVLVGGTALALQIGHRVSEDLDFAFLSPKLPVGKLDALIRNIEQAGIPVSLLTPTSAISAFRINHGAKLLDYARDYVIGGAKVTFFARGRNAPAKQIDFLRGHARRWPATSFSILDVDGLFVMKSMVLADRARSRDLFDLMTLIRDHGYLLEDGLESAARLAPVDERDIERHKAVLTGAIDLDKDDEGFDSVAINTVIEDIYRFFDEKVSDYEKRQATRIFGEPSPEL